MKARDRKQYMEAWNRHIAQLGVLAAEASAADYAEFQQLEKNMREWVRAAADKAFPEPTGAGELPNGAGAAA